MSCDFFFGKWKKTITKLDELVKLDIEYQETKANDKIWCDAVQRLTGILGNYIFLYNEITDCYHHNLQVQKAEYMMEIVKAIVARILELKYQLRKLTGSEHQFMGHGLIDHKITTNDILLADVLPKIERDEKVKTILLESIQKAENRKSKSISVMDPELPKVEENKSLEQKENWWENDDDSNDKNVETRKGINITAIYELEKSKELTAEELETKKMATLIQAYVKSRKVTLLMIRNKLQREKWEKELNGTLQPQAREEIRDRGAKILQRFFRAYFEIKRKRFDACKRDQILAIRRCEKSSKISQEEEESKIVKLNKKRIQKFKEYEKQWHENYNNIKQKYIERKHDTIEEDVRDEIMHWFQNWYDKAIYFLDIPKEKDGGSVLIVKEEIQSPEEWLEKYEASLAKKRANKNKSAQELKYEKLQAKKEKIMLKKAEHIKKRMEEKMLKKMMKNPKYHPGYQYPESKKIQQLIQSMEDYKTNWFNLDILEEPGVKEKFVLDIDIHNAYMDAKIEIRKSVDVSMRETFKILNKALKEDYKRNGEEMPKPIKERIRRRKKQHKHNMHIPEDIANKLEDLAHRGFLKEYPEVKIKDFIGDPNFAGDDFRCNLKQPEAFSGETTALWWERCRDLSQGSQRILLVGGKGCGKTTLVHILASMNDAVLYEVDPAGVPEQLVSAVYLTELAAALATCARATQPAVIYIKHAHTLYYRKAPPGEDMENLNLIKRCLLRKLLKKIHKTDKISIVASCMDPWLCLSKQMLRQFPNVVLLPNTNYSTVTILLNNWMLENHVVPRDLDIQSLAHVLQGYSFAHIRDTLDKFLTADRVIRIAAHGLPAHDVYESFLESEEVKIDYEKYLKWYIEKTHWGKKGKKLLEDQKEFQQLLEKWQQKQKKRKKLDNARSDTSTNI